MIYQNHLHGKGFFQRIWCASICGVLYLFTHHALAQTGNGPQLHIDDPRPVAKAVEELVSLYKYVVTYEDPHWTYSGDLLDVTTQVRQDLGRYHTGNAPKVTRPLGGKLTLTVPPSSPANTQTMASVLDQLMRLQSTRGEGGHFRVVQVGDVFHVVPSEVRDQNGNWISQRSILEVPISLPMENRSESEMLEAIVKAVSAADRVKFYVGGGAGTGGGIANPHRPASYPLGADNELASSVLMRALHLLNDQKFGTWIVQRLTWQVLYDSDENAYFLNLSVVPDRTPSPGSTSVQKKSSGPPVNATSSGPQ